MCWLSSQHLSKHLDCFVELWRIVERNAFFCSRKSTKIERCAFATVSVLRIGGVGKSYKHVYVHVYVHIFVKICVYVFVHVCLHT